MAAVWAAEDSRVDATSGEETLPTVDPFEADDRFAQLPVDPFDEPTEEETPHSDTSLDEVEEALEQELDSRSMAPEESEPAETDSEEEAPMESPLEVVEESSPAQSEQRSQVGGEAKEEELEFHLQVPEPSAPSTVRPFALEQSQQFADEIAQSQQSCKDEIAAMRADKISSVDLNIRVEGKPGEDYPYECTLGDEQLQPRYWSGITYTWKASALCHKPLYFEQDQLERHGHDWGPLVQPWMSGAHFFTSVAILPYKMGIETPNECVYVLGHYRPGSCAPYLIEAVPFTWRAAAFQGGVLTGMSVIYP
jgi:hypothetical protein